MARYKNKSIAERGGLQAMLDDPIEMAKHNGNGYKLYKEWRYKVKLNTTARAKLFNVSWGAMAGWDRWEDEHGK